MADENFGYFNDELEVNKCQELVLGLVDFVKSQGPFDGVMGFSEGGILAAMLLIEDSRQPFVGFKCGILFSAAPPLDPDVVRTGRVRSVDPASDGVVIKVPTAHISGLNEPFEQLRLLSPLAPLWAEVGMEDPKKLQDNLAQLCDDQLREAFLHELGHEVPGAHSTEGLSGALRAIERTIENARDQST